jgi:collagenase-like PrtC family protease
MKYFSMPADFKKETIDAYEILNRSYPDSRVIETYGNITIGNDLESGRPVDTVPGVDLAGLCHYIAYSKQKNIDFSYTVNASYMQNREFTREGLTAIYRFLGKIHKAGVRSLTVTLPSLIDVLGRLPYDFRIKGSTIYQVTNVNKALELKKIGAGRIERLVVDESINRKFNLLQRIREAVELPLEIIVNSVCHKDCSYRMFHYNQIAGDSAEISSGCSDSYYPHKCLLRRYENCGNMLKLTWVRPEDIKFYTSVGINYFKLQGRQTVLKGDPVRALEVYFKEDYQGDLFDLLNLFAPVSSFNVPVDNNKLEGFIKYFYEHPGFCRHDCEKCRYCESFAERIIDLQQLENIYRSAKEYYSEFDPVKENTDAVIQGESLDRKPIADDIKNWLLKKI